MIDFDTDIIELCRKNERKAQMQLYSIFYKRVYNACYRVLYDSFEAENAMQESFLKAFTNLESYRESISFETWLVRIAVNTSIDRLRKKEVDVIPLDENLCEDISDEDDDDWEQTYEKAQQIKAAIEKLPPTSRLIVNLYLLEGFKHEAIAEKLGITPGAVRVHYMRAKQKLIELI